MKLRKMMTLLTAIREAQSAAPTDTAPMWSWQMAKAAHAMEPHASQFREAMATGTNIQQVQEIEQVRHAIIHRLAEKQPNGSPRMEGGEYVFADQGAANAVIETELAAKFPNAAETLAAYNAKVAEFLDQDVDVKPTPIPFKLWPKLAPPLFDRLFVMIAE